MPTTFLTASGQIDHRAVVRAARRAARAELLAYVTGAPTYRQAFRAALRLKWELAEVEAECARGRAEFAKLSPTEQRIRHMEFRIRRLRHGLAMPVDEHALAIAEAELSAAREWSSAMQIAAE